MSLILNLQKLTPTANAGDGNAVLASSLSIICPILMTDSGSDREYRQFDFD